MHRRPGRASYYTMLTDSGSKLAPGELLRGGDPRLEPCGWAGRSFLQPALTDKGWRTLSGKKREKGLPSQDTTGAKP